MIKAENHFINTTSPALKFFCKLAVCTGTFFCITVFFTGCHNVKKNPVLKEISVADKAWMTKFFQDILLDQSAIYTLWGSKPMTLIQISYYTDEEILAYYNQLTEKEKKEVELFDDYDLDMNWEKWEKVKKLFPSQRHLFFKKELTEDGKIARVYFVNLFQTAYILQQNYSIFRNVVGFDFDPVKIVYEIQDPKSEFWNKSLVHAGLQGILFGYGLKNALAFQWKHWEAAPFLKGVTPRGSTQTLKRATIQDFPIPGFMIFTDYNIVDQYEKERETIQRIYKNRDFLEITLEQFLSPEDLGNHFRISKNHMLFK
jgi:hypothetical protein